MFKKKLYIEGSKIPFKLSRTKIDLYFECKRCFYLDQKFGIRRPHGAPLVINNKIVEDFKSELDKCRLEKTIHPHLKKLNKNFIPIQHPMLYEWKNSFKGTGFHHKDTNFYIYGIIDDIWLSESSKKNYSIIIKSTSKKDQLNFENIWPGYWRQLSLYSFILSKNSLSMSKTGILIYINTPTNFNEIEDNQILRLNFFEKILNFDWIDDTLQSIYSLLNNSETPESSKRCKYCNYYYNVKNITNE